MGARRWTSRPEVWCACGSLTVVVAPFFRRAWGLRPLSSSTRRHLDLRHGEGPLDLIWWLGHHPYPLLTDGSRPASHGRLGWPVASAFVLGGQVRREMHAGLRFGIPEDIYVATEQLAEEEWWL